MNCPSCSTPLEPGSRFCGVCGHRLEPQGQRPPGGLAGVGAKPTGATPKPVPAKAPIIETLYSPGAPPGRDRVATPAPGVPRIATPGQQPRVATPPAGQPRAVSPVTPAPSGSAPKPKPGIGGAVGQKPRGPAPKPDGDQFIGQSLNGRFRIDSKIGEGGFGAVYRGIQLATGRKVALKLLHPEMTNDENLVARFRREGLVLCNLRDAHTITTYDFDQTPEGTLYIAMELLEGRSLHQIFHDEAPIDWRRMFKILTEMCSSLAEAHAQGIVHRDLKPENIYLESRPGNPEFVKILDFGIAKVMRGEGSMDPQAPQLTATGQTLGTLEYMSPEQLMGKQLDGRSDVYALGVLAYELITGRLPFPDAKGPAGLITAQLKQTPKAPSTVKPETQIPASVDKVLLKCLEKDKNNRYADVTALSFAAQEVLALGGASVPMGKPKGADVLETQKGEPMNLPPPPAMPAGVPPTAHAAAGGSVQVRRDPTPPPPSAMHPHAHAQGGPHAHGPHGQGPQGHAPGPNGPYPGNHGGVPHGQGNAGSGPWQPGGSYSTVPQGPSSSRWVWLALGLLLLGAVTGGVLAYVL